MELGRTIKSHSQVHVLFTVVHTSSVRNDVFLDFFALHTPICITIHLDIISALFAVFFYVPRLGT